MRKVTVAAITALIGEKPVLQVALILLFAAFLTFPCLLGGLPLGHDTPTHVAYQQHFSRQFWGGDLYPRWLAEENRGAGSPIFLIQYPLPYFVTALLRAVTSFPVGPARETRELGVMLFVALSCAGLSARSWTKRFSSPLAATFAALGYIALPYFTTLIYTRAGIGELWALVWMPLILSSLESARTDARWYLRLSVCLALLILSNLLLALLFLPAMLAYGRLAVTDHPEGGFYRGVGLACLLGAGLAGIYLIPAVYYRQLFHLQSMGDNLPNFEILRHFLCLDSSVLDDRSILLSLAVTVWLAMAAAAHLLRLEKDAAAKVATAIALALGLLSSVPDLGERVIAFMTPAKVTFDQRPAFEGMLLLSSFSTISVGIVAYCRCQFPRDRRQLTLLVIASLAFIVMLPVAAPVWKAVPALALVQFPFRLGSILTLAVAGLFACAFGNMAREPAIAARIAVSGIALAAISTILVAGINPPSYPYRSTSGHVDIMYRSYVASENLGAFAARVGTRPSWYTAPTAHGGEIPLRAEVVSGAGKASVRRESPRLLRVAAECRSEARVRITQLYFPLWRILPIPKNPAACALTSSADGFLELAVPAGKEVLFLYFDGGAPERWGWMVSGGTLLLILCCYLLLSPRRLLAPGTLPHRKAGE